MSTHQSLVFMRLIFIGAVWILTLMLPFVRVLLVTCWFTHWLYWTNLFVAHRFGTHRRCFRRNRVTRTSKCRCLWGLVFWVLLLRLFFFWLLLFLVLRSIRVLFFVLSHFRQVFRVATDKVTETLDGRVVCIVFQDYLAQNKSLLIFLISHK